MSAEQHPNVIGIKVMQHLKEIGLPATPENYERYYYELSGLPRPEPEPLAQDMAALDPNLAEVLRDIAEEISQQTASLAKDLGEKGEHLASNVTTLKGCRDKQEIVLLLSTVINQASGIQNTVETSHKELQETRSALNAVQSELAETRQMLNEDPLTGALNRRGMEQMLYREVARCRSSDSQFVLIMIDLDHFKQVNDTHGHEAGDQMLIHFIALMRSVLRKSDALARYGGEEFALLLPNTDLRGALLVVGRLQQLMKKTPLMYSGKSINTTFSAGVALLRGQENGHALLRRADEALYKAKEGGRNQFVTAA